MPKYKNEPCAVRVYTVCDESKYLIVRNVPSLGCDEELLKLLCTYGPVAECKPMDAEDCEAYTDVYWIKFCQINNARFAKRKLDESIFLGHQIQVTYAPECESLFDTKEKLEERRKEVLARLNPRRTKGPSDSSREPSLTSTPSLSQRELSESRTAVVGHGSSIPLVSSDQEYFPSESMNQTVKLVREKLNKIESSSEALGSSKKSMEHLQNCLVHVDEALRKRLQIENLIVILRRAGLISRIYITI